MSTRWTGLLVGLGVVIAIAVILLLTVRALDRRADADTGAKSHPLPAPHYSHQLLPVNEVAQSAVPA